MQNAKKYKNSKIKIMGFGIIDVIIGIAIMLTISTALFGIMRSSLILSTIVRSRVNANNIAVSEIEMLRGLSYENIGTIGGDPSGIVEGNSIKTIDNINYSIDTNIYYYDDPIDGTGTNDSNSITRDYKIAEITVSHSVYGINKSIKLFSTFIPRGIEQVQ